MSTNHSRSNRPQEVKAPDCRTCDRLGHACSPEHNQLILEADRFSLRCRACGGHYDAYRDHNCPEEPQLDHNVKAPRSLFDAENEAWLYHDRNHPIDDADYETWLDELHGHNDLPNEEHDLDLGNDADPDHDLQLLIDTHLDVMAHRRDTDYERTEPWHRGPDGMIWRVVLKNCGDREVGSLQVDEVVPF